MKQAPRLLVVLALAAALGGCGGSASPTTSVGTNEPDETELTETLGPEESLPAETTQGNQPDPTRATSRPSTVDLTISGTSGGEADGEYHASAIARWCGPDFIIPDGFIYGFPKDGDYNPGDVTFGAPELLGGASTSTFNVSVSVTAKDGTHPPVFSFSPGTEASDSGMATRAEAGTTTTLTVSASNDFGEHIQITATCGP